MKKVSALITLFALLALALAVNARTVNADIAAPPVIGATIANFSLPDASGAAHSLDSLKGKNGVVLIFVATHCPVSNAYNERMEKLAQDFKARGINVVGINSNSTESASDVKDHAAKNNLTFVDPQGRRQQDRRRARRDAHAGSLFSRRQQQASLSRPHRQQPRRHAGELSELRDAIEATLAGKPVPKTTANAFGCSIKRAE